MNIYIAEDFMDNCRARFLTLLGKIFNMSDFHDFDQEKQEEEIGHHIDNLLLLSNDYHTSIVEIRYFLCVY